MARTKRDQTWPACSRYERDEVYDRTGNCINCGRAAAEHSAMRLAEDAWDRVVSLDTHYCPDGGRVGEHCFAAGCPLGRPDA